MIGNCEGANLLNHIAEELDTQRMFVGWWEHIHNATADSELTALLNQVSSGVGTSNEPGHQFITLELVISAGDNLRHIADSRDQRLHHCANGCHDHAQRHIEIFRVRQMTQNLNSATDGVLRWR